MSLTCKRKKKQNKNYIRIFNENKIFFIILLLLISYIFYKSIILLFIFHITI
jgi:preprotein translocase subunit Sec63